MGKIIKAVLTAVVVTALVLVTAGAVVQAFGGTFLGTSTILSTAPIGAGGLLAGSLDCYFPHLFSEP